MTDTGKRRFVWFHCRVCDSSVLVQEKSVNPPLNGLKCPWCRNWTDVVEGVDIEIPEKLRRS